MKLKLAAALALVVLAAPWMRAAFDDSKVADAAMSAANAIACRSYISLTCSVNESGTPIGAPGSSRGSPLALYDSTR